MTQPKKYVRFAYKNTFYSPLAVPTPNLSFSSSTVPSSSGPITPPSTMKGLPGPMPFVPPYVPAKPMHSSRYASPARPHPYLDTSAVTWDMRDHQSAASRSHHSISNRTLCEPATNPPLPFLRITSQHLPWSIKVYSSNNSFVTVDDVLSSIYRSLRTNVAPTEFNTLPSPKHQQRATRAYEERYRRQRSARIYEAEKRGGMKRVDFLMAYTLFHGISNSGRHVEEWQLHVT